MFVWSKIRDVIEEGLGPTPEQDVVDVSMTETANGSSNPGRTEGIDAVSSWDRRDRNGLEWVKKNY